VKRDAFNHQSTAATLELGCPVRLAHLLQLGKEQPGLGERRQETFKFASKADNGNRSRFVAKEAHHLVLPVNVLHREARNVGLSAVQVPAEFVKGAALRVSFLRDDVSVSSL
jgi:hypothetical protein